jgi:hypothetical protein
MQRTGQHSLRKLKPQKCPERYHNLGQTQVVVRPCQVPQKAFGLITTKLSQSGSTTVKPEEF